MGSPQGQNMGGAYFDIRALNDNLDKDLATSQQKMDTATQRIVGSQTKIAASVDQLKSKYDPLSTTLDRLLKQSDQLQATYAKGKIGADDYIKTQQALSAQIDKTIAALNAQNAAMAASQASASKGSGLFERIAEFAASIEIGQLVGETFAKVSSAVIKAAESYEYIHQRLALVTQDESDLEAVQDRLGSSALRTGSNLKDTVDLYVKIKQLRSNLSDSTVTTIVENFNKTLALSGATAGQANTAVGDFLRTLESGVLEGRELTTMFKDNSQGAALLAEKLKIGTDGLKKLSESGKITADTLIGVYAAGGKVTDKFTELETTLPRAGENFATSLTLVVGNLDKATGISSTLAKWIDNMAKSLDVLGKGLTSPLDRATTDASELNSLNNTAINLTKALKDERLKLTEAIATGDTVAQSAAQTEIANLSLQIEKTKTLQQLKSAQLQADLASARSEFAKLQAGGDGNVPGVSPETLRQLAYSNAGSVASPPGSALSKFDLSRSTLTDDKGFIAAVNAAFGSFSNYLELELAAAKQANLDGDASHDQLKLIKVMGPFDQLGLRIDALTEQIKVLNDGGTNNPTPPKITLGPGKKLKTDFLGDGAGDPNQEFQSAVDQLLARIANDHEEGRPVAVDNIEGNLTRFLDEFYKKTQDTAAVINKLNVLVDEKLIEPEDIERLLRVIVPSPTITPIGDGLTDAQREASQNAQSQGGIAAIGLGLGVKRKPTTFDGYGVDLRGFVAQGLVQGLETSNFGKSLRNTIYEAANDGLTRSVENFTKQIFAALATFFEEMQESQGGVGSTGILGAIGSIFGEGAVGHASGGFAPAGRAIRVGELGPELLVPTSDSYIIPNATGASYSTGGGRRSVVNVGGAQVIINGNADSVTVRQLQVILEAHQRALPQIIDKRVADQQERGAY